MSELKYTSCDEKKDFVMCLGEFSASQKLPARGGRFVYWDISDGATTGGWNACTDAITTFGGWVEQHTDGLTSGATSATKGATKFQVIDIENRIFELPYAAAGATATLTEAVGRVLIGKKIDLYVDSDGVQYAENATSQAVLQVKGYSVERNTLKVMVIPAYIVQAS
jgi:hypothetical protein